jgi:hypothetical protein
VAFTGHKMKINKAYLEFAETIGYIITVIVSVSVMIYLVSNKTFIDIAEMAIQDNPELFITFGVFGVFFAMVIIFFLALSELLSELLKLRREGKNKGKNAQVQKQNF